MNPISLIIGEILYRPIFNLLIIFLLIFWGNLWIAIISLTIIIRLILLKPTLAGNDMQKHMTDLQPKMQEIQEKHKNDPQKMSEETTKLLKSKWKGPLKWCLMMIIQIPVFIGLFWVIKNFSNSDIDGSSLYSFIDPIKNWYLNIENVNHIFLWIDLLQNWNTRLAVAAAILMFFQIKLTMLNKPQQPSWTQQLPWGQNLPDTQNMMKYMNIFLIAMISLAVYQLPGWVGLYITTTTFFGVIQYTIQYRQLLKIKIISLKEKLTK